jgi:hypothetical protein
MDLAMNRQIKKKKIDEQTAGLTHLYIHRLLIAPYTRNL